jgi:hypothetical protein
VSTVLLPSIAGDRAPAPCRLELCGPGDADRPALEAFIAAEFRRVHGASVQHFCQVLAGCRDAQGRWIAALGYTPARDGALFLEQYLDEPVEAAIGARIGHAVARPDVVEVGNLAGTDVGAARALIVAMTRHLHALGLVWVAFTATRALLNSFARLRLVPTVLADADPARLGAAGRDWGSYYASRPQVMFGNIGFGHAQLA